MTATVRRRKWYSEATGEEEREKNLCDSWRFYFSKCNFPLLWLKTDGSQWVDRIYNDPGPCWLEPLISGSYQHYQVPVGSGKTTKRSSLLNRQGVHGRWSGHKLSGCWLPLDAEKALRCLHFLSLLAIKRVQRMKSKKAHFLWIIGDLLLHLFFFCSKQEKVNRFICVMFRGRLGRRGNWNPRLPSFPHGMFRLQGSPQNKALAEGIYNLFLMRAEALKWSLAAKSSWF